MGTQTSAVESEMALLWMLRLEGLGIVEESSFGSSTGCICVVVVGSLKTEVLHASGSGGNVTPSWPLGLYGWNRGSRIIIKGRDNETDGWEVDEPVGGPVAESSFRGRPHSMS